MAQSFIYTCRSCQFAVEAWDDGNPYQEGADKKRKYYYHPEPMPNPPKPEELKWLRMTEGEDARIYGLPFMFANKAFGPCKRNTACSSPL